MNWKHGSEVDTRLAELELLAQIAGLSIKAKLKGNTGLREPANGITVVIKYTHALML